MASLFKRPMTEIQFKQWEKTRELGPVLYVLRCAFFGAVGICVAHLFRHPLPDLRSAKSISDFLEVALAGVILGIPAGIWEWHSNEKKYLNKIDQQYSGDLITQANADSSQRGTLNGKSY
jgi:hypothetical protein